MKLSGIVLLVIGVGGGALALFQSLLATTPPHGDPTVAATAFPAAQLYFSAAAFMVGGLLVVFGGSGVIKSKDPAVRN